LLKFLQRLLQRFVGRRRRDRLGIDPLEEVASGVIEVAWRVRRRRGLLGKLLGHFDELVLRSRVVALRMEHARFVIERELAKAWDIGGFELRELLEGAVLVAL